VGNEVTTAVTQVATPENCGLGCQFEWIEVSSNFFSVAVYTPSLIVAGIGYLIWRKVQKNKKTKKVEARRAQ